MIFCSVLAGGEIHRAMDKFYHNIDAGPTVTAVLMSVEEIKKRQDDLKILNLIKISINVKNISKCHITFKNGKIIASATT
jgi:hypothetical protein